MTTTEVLAFAAAGWALLMAASPLLQVREIISRRDSTGVSGQYFAVLLVGFALWSAYGMAKELPALYVPNIVATIIDAFTLVMIRRFRPRRQE